MTEFERTAPLLWACLTVVGALISVVVAILLIADAYRVEVNLSATSTQAEYVERLSE